MIRGTTPTHVFQLPIDAGTLKEVRITYKQHSKVVLEKTEADVTMEGRTISFVLTQEESMRFESGVTVKLQVKVLTVNGTVLASPIREFTVEDILNSEVLE